MGRSSRRAHAWVFFGLAVGAVLWALPAGAETKTHEAKSVQSARSLFYKALSLQDQGRWAEALELLETVAETRESPQVRFNIAFNQEHLGRLAAAARSYERAIALAAEHRAETVTRAAYDRLARLAPRIARLVLRPAGDDVSVILDGVELASSDWGRALPVEVGDHTVQARASGHEPYRARVNLAGGETRELRLELAPIREERPVEAIPPMGPPPAAAPAPRPAAQKRRPARARPQSESNANVLPYVAGGAALLSVAVAGVFYGLRQDALDEMREGCDGARCPGELRSTDRRGAVFTTAANVALAAGLGLAGVSAGLFVANLGDDDEEGREVGVVVSSRF